MLWSARTEDGELVGGQRQPLERRDVHPPERDRVALDRVPKDPELCRQSAPNQTRNVRNDQGHLMHR